MTNVSKKWGSFFAPSLITTFSKKLLLFTGCINHLIILSLHLLNSENFLKMYSQFLEQKTIFDSQAKVTITFLKLTWYLLLQMFQIVSKIFKTQEPAWEFISLSRLSSSSSEFQAIGEQIFLMTGFVTSLGLTRSGLQVSRGRIWQSVTIFKVGYCLTMS